MPDIILRRRVSEPTLPLNIALNGIAEPPVATPVSVKIFWRWEDEPDMLPEFLGETTPGNTLTVPFDPQGREVRFMMNPRSAKGIEAVSDLKNATYAVYEPPPVPELATAVIVAAEDIDWGNILDIYDDAGTTKARKADATDNSKPAQGFATADALTGANLTVGFAGNLVEGLIGLTPGIVCFLSETAGGVTQTPITSGTGKISQEIGVAVSLSTMVFDPKEPIELA